jgi:hypothetical protein
MTSMVSMIRDARRGIESIPPGSLMGKSQIAKVTLKRIGQLAHSALPGQQIFGGNP